MSCPDRSYTLIVYGPLPDTSTLTLVNNQSIIIINQCDTVFFLLLKRECTKLDILKWILWGLLQCYDTTPLYDSDSSNAKEQLQ